MTISFQVDKFVNYLKKYKADLPNLYKWNVNIEKLVKLEVFQKEELEKINRLSFYEKELQLKKAVGQKLKQTQRENPILFDKLCLWIIKDWGGISTANDTATLVIVNEFFKTEKPSFNRIASASKVGSYMFPEKNVIYDSRVAYSLNWIILSENAGNYYFPIPEGRNSKMSAFDMNVLIRLKNISHYRPDDISQLDNRLFIKNADKEIFINKKEAYFELNKLVKQISEKLWIGEEDKMKNLYYTEMLLFSIADRQVFMNITERFGKA